MASEVISTILSLKLPPSFAVIFTMSPFASSSRAVSGCALMTLVVVKAVENRKAGLPWLNFYKMAYGPIEFF